MSYLPWDNRDGRSHSVWLRRGALIWFAFAVFPVSQAFHNHHSGLHLAAVLVAGTAFFVLWISLVMRRTRVASMPVDLALSGVLLVMAVVLSLTSGADWIGLFPFVAVRLAVCLPTELAVPGVVFAGLTGFATALATPARLGGAFTIFLSSVGVGVLLINMRQLRLANAELASARDEVARLAVSDERLRFARDMHDLLGHSLTVIAMKGELAERLVETDPARAKAEMASVTDVARTSLADVRAAVSGYRRLELAAEVGGARAALMAAGIDVDVRVPDVTLPADVEATLAWAIREGTTNVVRHSHASHCDVRVVAGLSEASLDIADDGNADTPSAREGNGLRGLRERVERLGGSVEAGPRPEGGFRLRVAVPVT
ncbi:MAG: sensor histidine kinase [Actinobacteria bacterium]|nr:sensor histidine kinase [Actinomycetota bacterium]